MEQDQQNLRQYAWNYVSFYGGQQARLLLLFAGVGSGLTLGAAALLRTDATEIVVAPLGVSLMVLGILFWVVNRGLSEKVRRGEEALRHLDAELKLPDAKGGAPHVLRLLEQGAGAGESARKCCGGCDARTIGSAVYILFALLGFFFTMAPYYPNEMAPKPLVIETPAPLVKATPHRLPPGYPRPTPDFNQRRFQGSTPFPGGPNRLNNFPGRGPGMSQPGMPSAAVQQPGVPTGMPPRFAPPAGAAPAGAVPPGGAPNGALQPGSFPGGVQPGRPAIVRPAPAPATSAPVAPSAPAASAPAIPPAPAAAINSAQPPAGKQ